MKTVSTVGLWIIGIGLMFMVVGAILSITGARVNQGVDYANMSATTESVDAVLTRSKELNEAYASLKAVKANILIIENRRAEMITENGSDMQQWPLHIKEEWRTQGTTLQQYQLAYNTACGKYQAAWDDEYQAVAAPDDLPRDCSLITE